MTLQPTLRFASFELDPRSGELRKKGDLVRLPPQPFKVLTFHDEFFYEEGRPVFKRRGGFATLRTMIDALRQQNPEHTLVVDGGDCFQGSAVAALSKGQAIPPLLNRIQYDLVLPGNWEVVYGKDMLIKDMSLYNAAKVCANMFHEGATDAPPIFPPYQIFDVGSIWLSRTVRSRRRRTRCSTSTPSGTPKTSR